MIHQPEAKAYSRAKERRNSWALIVLVAGVGLLFALTGLAYGGAVKEVNSGSPGQTLDLKTLPVRGKTTLVDVYSPNCPPCMRLAPLLGKLARKRPDLAIRKVNIQRPEIKGQIDWQSPLAKQLNLKAVPHFLLFDRQGKLIAEGREAQQQLMQWLVEAGLLKKN